MLIKGQDVSRIKRGNTLTNDQLGNHRFDYMLSNPPFGVDWKTIEGDIKKEHIIKGFDGRFGPGLPRVDDGSLLFLMHLLSKMRDYDPNDSDKSGGRIGIILNGSPLFNGGAGSGESEIRRNLLESDLLEAIVALPTDMFYNTDIGTYVWVLSNKKKPDRKGKVSSSMLCICPKMRKSLGSSARTQGHCTHHRTFGSFEAVEPYILEHELWEHSSKRGRLSQKKTEKTSGRNFESYIWLRRSPLSVRYDSR